MATTTIHSTSALDDLSKTFEWVRLQTALEAQRQLEQAKAKSPALRDAVVYVDRQKGKPIEQVKLFGEIIIASPSGEVQQAIDLAHEFVVAACGSFQNPTGFYAGQFMWFINGEPASVSRAPNADRMGKRGNAQLVNRAGYASAAEIFIPNGILYGAYSMLRGMYQYSAITLSYGYAQENAFGQVWPATRKSRRPMAVPVLTIGHPMAAFRNRASAPGVNIRKRARSIARDKKRAARAKARRERMT